MRHVNTQEKHAAHVRLAWYLLHVIACGHCIPRTFPRVRCGNLTPEVEVNAADQGTAQSGSAIGR